MNSPLILQNIRTNNLKIPYLQIPLNKVTLVTGVSGSGKSSLVFDTIFAESLLSYGQILSKTVGIYIPPVKTSSVEYIENLPVAVALEQKIPAETLKLSIGEFCGITDLLIDLFVTFGEITCSDCGTPAIAWTPHRIAEEIFKRYPKGTRFYVTAPLGSIPYSQIANLVKELVREGFIRFVIDGKIISFDDIETIGWSKERDFSIVVDRLVLEEAAKDRLIDSCTLAFDMSYIRRSPSTQNGLPTKEVVFIFPNGKTISFSDHPLCYQCGKFYQPISKRFFNPLYPEGRCPSCDGLGCTECHNTGRTPTIFNVLLNGQSFPHLLSLPLGDLMEWMEGVNSSLRIGLLPPYIEWLKTIKEFNLDYLSLDRSLLSLSAGELQKVRLIEFWKNPLFGALSIFDEPLKFLDSKERITFSERIRSLIHKGQTVIIVDHNPDAISMAHFIIELGPGSGIEGGKITWIGEAKDYDRFRRFSFSYDRKRGIANGKIQLIGAGGNNLKDISVSFPLGALTYVTGPVGSGKTTLVFETLVPALRARFLRKRAHPKPYRELRCLLEISSVTSVREKIAITRPSDRSFVATFLNLLSPIRQFYAQLSEARQRGFRAKHFSWNTPEGACPRCGGKGTVFSKEGSRVEIPCPHCEGKRYREEVLSVRYKGYSIADVLEMSLGDISKLFSFLYPIKTPLEMARSMNLSHILFGQHLVTLSGGELYRIWMIRQIISLQSSEGHRILCFDYPTSGLHPREIESIVDFWDRLTISGQTVIVCDSYEPIEGICDWVINLGPGSGPEGGFVIYEGPPRS
ncbi:MAG: hypothetical protein N2260_02825 [Syntrophobacterales bacterium]|nr:hypothetical protein [Syntrophobacterales bacterium]